MTNFKRWFLILAGGGLLALLVVGLVIVGPALAQGPGGGMGGWGHGGMMGGWGPGGMMGGMMGGWGPGGMMGGPGMMGYTQGYTGTPPYGPGGMMGGWGPGGMMGGPGMMGGMMGGWGPGGGMGGMMGGGSPLLNPEPLAVAEARAAVGSFLDTVNDDNLVLGEVMIFDNHAYAEIVEADSGIGAMEVLVDPVTKAVYPEMGPNMMWNLKYGMMAGYNPAGGSAPTGISADMPVSPAQAIETAQAYLDASLPNNNLTVEDEAEPFYGYYTLHVSRNGETIGMLSVNGFSQQVFLHVWHGDLIEMSEG